MVNPAPRAMEQSPVPEPLQTITLIINWEGPDDSTAWKDAITTAIQTRLPRLLQNHPGYEPAHPLDPEWLSAHGHTYWQERSALTGGSSYLKNLYYVTVDLQGIAPPQ
jgi:hypothetical protein